MGAGPRHTALFSLRLLQGCARIRESRHFPTGSTPARGLARPGHLLRTAMYRIISKGRSENHHSGRTAPRGTAALLPYYVYVLNLHLLH